MLRLPGVRRQRRVPFPDDCELARAVATVRDIEIDADGRQRCWKCGGQNFTQQRTTRSKVSVGLGAALTKKKLRCVQCGTYNDVGSAKPYQPAASRSVAPAMPAPLTATELAQSRSRFAMQGHPMLKAQELRRLQIEMRMTRGWRKNPEYWRIVVQTDEAELEHAESSYQSSQSISSAKSLAIQAAGVAHTREKLEKDRLELERVKAKGTPRFDGITASTDHRCKTCGYSGALGMNRGGFLFCPRCGVKGTLSIREFRATERVCSPSPEFDRAKKSIDEELAIQFPEA